MPSIAEFRKLYPELAKVSDYDIATAYAQGEGIPLGLALSDLGLPQQNRGLMGDVGTALKQGVEQLPGVVTSVADLPFALTAGKRPISTAAEWIGEKTGFQPGEWAKRADVEYSPGYRESQAEVGQAWKENVNAREGLLREAMDVIKSSPQLAYAYGKNPSYVLNQVVNSLPSMVAGGLVGRGLMGIGARGVASEMAGPALPGVIERTVGSRWATPVAAGAGEGAVASGQNMEQAMEALGPNASPEAVRRAAGASMAAGAIDMLVAAGSGRVAQRLGFETPETMIAGGRKTGFATNAAGEVLYDAGGRPIVQGRPLRYRVIGGAASEGVLQEFPQSLQEAGWQNVAEGRDFTDSGPNGQGLMRQGVEGMMAGGFIGGGANVFGRGRTTTGLTSADLLARVAAARGEPVDLMKMPTEQPRLLFGYEGEGRNTTDAGITVFPEEDPRRRRTDSPTAVYEEVLRNPEMFSPEDVEIARAAVMQAAWSPRRMPQLGGLQSPQRDLFRGESLSPRPPASIDYEAPLSIEEGADTFPVEWQRRNQSPIRNLNAQGRRLAPQTPLLPSPTGTGERGESLPGTVQDMFTGEPAAPQDLRKQEGTLTDRFTRALSMGDRDAAYKIGAQAALDVGKLKEFHAAIQKLNAATDAGGVQVPSVVNAALSEVRDIVTEADLAERVAEASKPPTLPVREKPISDAARKGLFAKAMGGRENLKLLERLELQGRVVFDAARRQIEKLRASKKGGVVAVREQASKTLSDLEKQYNEALSKKHYGKLIALQKQAELVDAETGKAVEGMTSELPIAPAGDTPRQREIADKAVTLWRHGYLTDQQAKEIFEHAGAGKRKPHFDRAEKILGPAIKARADAVNEKAKKLQLDLSNMTEEEKAAVDKAADPQTVRDLEEFVRYDASRLRGDTNTTPPSNPLYEPSKRPDTGVREALARLMNIARYRYTDREKKLQDDLEQGMIDDPRTAEDAELAIERLKNEGIVSPSVVIAAQYSSKRMDEGAGEDVQGLTKATDSMVRSFLTALPKFSEGEVPRSATGSILAAMGVQEEGPMSILNKAALRLNTEKGGEFEGEFTAIHDKDGNVVRKAVELMLGRILNELLIYNREFTKMSDEDSRHLIAEMSDRFGDDVMEVVTRYLENSRMARHARAAISHPDFWFSGNTKSDRTPAKILNEDIRIKLKSVANLMLTLGGEKNASGNPDVMDRRARLNDELMEVYNNAVTRGQDKVKLAFPDFVMVLLSNQPGAKIYQGTSPDGKAANTTAMHLRLQLLDQKKDKTLGQLADRVASFAIQQKEIAARKAKAAERAPGLKAEVETIRTATKERLPENDGTTIQGKPYRISGEIIADESGRAIVTDLEGYNEQGEFNDPAFDALNDKPAAEVFNALDKMGAKGGDVNRLKNALNDFHAKQIAAKEKEADKAVTTKVSVGDTAYEISTPKRIKEILNLWQPGPIWDATTPAETRVINWLEKLGDKIPGLPRIRLMAKELKLKLESNTPEVAFREILTRLDMLADQKKVAVERQEVDERTPIEKTKSGAKGITTANYTLRNDKDIGHAPESKNLPTRASTSQARESTQEMKKQLVEEKIPAKISKALARRVDAAQQWLDEGQKTIGRAFAVARSLGIKPRDTATFGPATVESVTEQIIARIDAIEKQFRPESSKLQQGRAVVVRGPTGPSFGSRRKSTQHRESTGQLMKVANKVAAEFKSKTEKKEELKPITRRGFIQSMIGLVTGAVLPQSRAMAAGIESTLRAGDYNGALRMIAQGSSNPAFRVLARRLLALNTPLKLSVIDVGQMGPARLSGAAGVTSLSKSSEAKNNRIEMYLRGDVGLNERTFLHEMIHAAIMSRYDELAYYLANPGLQGRAADPALKLLKDVWYEFQSEVKKEFPNRAALENAPAGVRIAATDIDEFLNYALTDPETQDWMRSRKYQGTTLWGRFKEFVRNILGIGNTEPSWLDAALRVSNEVLDQAAQDQPDFRTSRILMEKARDARERANKREELSSDPSYGFTVHGNGDLTNSEVHLTDYNRFGELAGNPVVGFAIRTPEGDLIGQATLVLNADGLPTHVMNVVVGESLEQPPKGVSYDLKNLGWGTKLVKAMLEASPSNTLIAIDVQKAAIPIWKAWNARWPSGKLENGNAYLTLENFEARRNPDANPWRNASLSAAGTQHVERLVGEGETQSAALGDLDFTSKSESLNPAYFMHPLVRNRFAGPIAQIKAAFNGAVRAVVPIRDIFESMKRAGVKTVDKFIESFDQRMSKQRQWEEVAERIGQDFKKLPYTMKRAVNQFLGTSTLKGWGYQPSWIDEPVKIDEDVKAMWDALSPEAQAVANRVFQHGDDMWRQKNQLINEAITESYAKERAEAANDPARLREIDTDEKADIAKYGKHLPRMVERPYAPLKRFGKWAVVGKSNEFQALEREYDDENTPAKRKQEIATRLRELKADPKHYEVNFRDWAGTAEDLVGDVKQRFDNAYKIERTLLAEQQHYELPYHVLTRLKAEIDDLDRNDKFVSSLQRAASNLYVEMLSQANARKNELERLGVAGFDEDMMKSFISQARADASLVSTLTSNRAILQGLRAMKREVDRAPNNERDNMTQLYNEVVRRYLNTTYYTDSTLQQKAMRMNSVMLLITSPAYLIQNATQVFMMALPKLASVYGWTNSAQHLLEVYQKLGVLNRLKEDAIDFTKLKDTFGADVANAIAKLQDAGKIDITIMQEIGKWAENGMMPSTEFGKWLGENKLTAAAGRGLTFAAGLPQRVEMLNRIVTGISAFQLKKTELDKRDRPSDMSEKEFAAQNTQKAIDYAGQIIDETQGAYDEAGAGRIFQSGNAPNIPVKLLLQFRKFQVIQLSFMIRDFVRAYARGKPANLSAEEWANEKRVAKRALAFAIAHYGAMTGALGLPFVGMVAGAFAALGAGGDDDEEPRPSLLAATPFATAEDRQLTELWMRRQLGGGSLATLMTRGIPTLAGLDLSTSIGAGAATYMLPYAKRGKTGPETARNVAWSALGATSGTVDRFLRAGDLLASGDVYKGMEQALPSGVGNAMQGLREGLGEGKTDRSGTLLTPAEDVSAWDTALKTLGLRTAADTERNLLQQKVTLTDQHYAAQRQELGDAYVKAKREGDGERLSELRREWLALSASMRRQGMKAPTLSDLNEYWTREQAEQRGVIGGVATKKANRNLALSGI